MMKGIIVYKSKYGATKKYAQWLREETGFDMIKVSDAKVVDLKKYEVLIFGGGIYASGIPVTSFLKKNIPTMSEEEQLQLYLKKCQDLNMKVQQIIENIA